MPPRIRVDEAYIRQVMAAIYQMSGEIPSIKGGGPGSLSGQILEDLQVRAGAEGFPAGVRLQKTVNTRGRELSGHLDAIRQQMNQFVFGLSQVLRHADNIEDINSISADEFRNRVTPGSPSGGPSTGQPSTETPSTEKPSAEKPGAEKPGAEEPGAEKPPKP